MNILPKLKSFLETAKKPLLVVLGPTASGKTALSLKLAHLFNGEIISTDSRQIYRQMDISTDAIQKDQQEGITHHLVNIVNPDKTLTLAEYRDLATQEIQKIYERKNLPILVGGTGLYISAIIENYEVPHIPPDLKLRKKLYKEAKTKGVEFIYKKLQKLDPEAAEKIHPNNLRYVIRAIEINLSSNKNKIDKKSEKSPFDLFLIGINWPREELYERIEQRIDNQLKRGLINEVKQLVRQGYSLDLPSMSSLGIKEIIPYIKGKISLQECIATLKLNTRHYAKRQMTWFRRYDNVNWLTPEDLKKITES